MNGIVDMFVAHFGVNHSTTVVNCQEIHTKMHNIDKHLKITLFFRLVDPKMSTSNKITKLSFTIIIIFLYHSIWENKSWSKNYTNKYQQKFWKKKLVGL